MNMFVSETDEYGVDIPREKRYLNTVSYDYSVQYIYDLIKRGKIILEVPFQRREVWKKDKASLLIESIIMNVPIPPLYFAEEEDGNWLVLDGLQRLSSIRDFYDNEFALSGLEIIKELEKKKYKDLPPRSKSLLDDGLLRVNIIKKDSHKDIKYDIFMRLNRGAVTLNYQELRNCLYRGNLNDAAKELCQENQDFLRILKQQKPHPRYLDTELIIRYFAISDNIAFDDDGNVYIREYRGKLVQFLNDYMDTHKSCTPEEKAVYKKRFNDTIQKVCIVFDRFEAFRDISTNNAKIYKTIADFIMPSFERIPKELLEAKRESVRTALKAYLSNEEIHNTLSIKTSDKDVLNKRIRLWFKELEDVLQIKFNR